MINVPVFSDENGTPHISIYVEDADGTFRRTQNEPLRLLRDDIKGISISQGDIVTAHYDRYEREWNTPTVTFHYGRPQSFFQFLRAKVAHNRFFVFTKPQLAGHISKLSLHELQLKNSASQRKVAILKEKYIEALELWSEAELEKLANQEQSSKHPLSHQDLNQVTHQISEPEANTRVNSDAVKKTDNIRYFRRDNLPEESPRQFSRQSPLPSPQRKTLFSNVQNYNPVERDFNKRKNLIREFSLPKSQSRIRAEQKDHNKHFFKRFISKAE